MYFPERNRSNNASLPRTADSQRDEEFPAQCLLLFERRAAQYLDMECLAILAWLLTDLLHLSIGVQRKTVM